MFTLGRRNVADVKPSADFDKLSESVGGGGVFEKTSQFGGSLCCVGNRDLRFFFLLLSGVLSVFIWPVLQHGGRRTSEIPASFFGVCFVFVFKGSLLCLLQWVWRYVHILDAFLINIPPSSPLPTIGLISKGKEMVQDVSALDSFADKLKSIFLLCFFFFFGFYY